MWSITYINDDYLCNGLIFYLSKWNQLRENKPNINHLDVGCRRKRFRDTNKESCEDKLRGQIDRHNCLEEKGFEEVCGIDNGKNED